MFPVAATGDVNNCPPGVEQKGPSGRVGLRGMLKELGAYLNYGNLLLKVANMTNNFGIDLSITLLPT